MEKKSKKESQFLKRWNFSKRVYFGYFQKEQRKVAPFFSTEKKKKKKKKKFIIIFSLFTFSLYLFSTVSTLNLSMSSNPSLS